MNDPNGLFFLNGLYHLFYQHHPHSACWGPMHWGHATSRDLLHWEHQPIALYPDSDLGAAFSGSGAVDWNNSSGLCREGSCPIAMFTHSGGQDGLQKQSLAFSPDRGRTWVLWRHNPVLANPGLADFRDPKIFRHTQTGRWIAAVAAGNHVRFYGSSDLFCWEHLSNFGPLQGAPGVWECPDLFPLQTGESGGQVRWVLLVSTMPAFTENGGGTRYFVGEFDGTRFASDNPADTVLWMDHGPDFYGAQTWSDIPADDGRRIAIAWMSSWEYAEKTPLSGWRGAMSIPRELTLAQIPGLGFRLRQTPVRELASLRGPEAFFSGPVGGDLLAIPATGPLEIEARFRPADARAFGLHVHADSQQRTTIGYDAAEQVLFVDRTSSGIVDFSPGFPTRSRVSLPLGDDECLSLRVLVDVASVEVFAQGGLASLTQLVFPARPGNGIHAWASGGQAVLESLAAWPLRPARRAAPGNPANNVVIEDPL